MLAPGPLPCRSKAGRLVPTRMAPARPEVEDDDLPLEGGERDGGTLVTNDRELEVWSGLVDDYRHRWPLRRAEDTAGTATPRCRPPDREGDENDNRHRQSCCQPPAVDGGPWVADLDRIVIGGERRSHEGNLLRGAVVSIPTTWAPVGSRHGSGSRCDHEEDRRDDRSGSSLSRPLDLPRWPKDRSSLELRPAGWSPGPGFQIDAAHAIGAAASPSLSAGFPAGTVVANVVGEVGYDFG